MNCFMLHALYGPSSKSVQVFNLCIALWWIAVVLLSMYGYVEFDLPVTLLHDPYIALYINIPIIITASMGFALQKRPHRILKTFALISGALWHAIIANMYVSQYPPLSMMMCVAVVLSIWLLGAVLFIAKCEG